MKDDYKTVKELRDKEPKTFVRVTRTIVYEGTAAMVGTLLNHAFLRGVGDAAIEENLKVSCTEEVVDYPSTQDKVVDEAPRIAGDSEK